MNKMYGFEGEVLHKYDATVMDTFRELFNNLPLAAVIQVYKNDFIYFCVILHKRIILSIES